MPLCVDSQSHKSMNKSYHICIYVKNKTKCKNNNNKRLFLSSQTYIIINTYSLRHRSLLITIN